jgi:HK97 family phage major capsid protein
MPSLDAVEQELKSFIGRNDRKRAELEARMLQVEQHLTAPRGGTIGGGGDGMDIGFAVAESPELKDFMSTTSRPRSGRITVGSFHKTAIVNATGLNQPLVQAYRGPGIIGPGQQRLTVRDLLPNLPITSNMVEFCKESSFTSNAGMQTAEGDTKGESALGFELLYAPVQTLAHWIPASRQVLDDATALAAYINARLTYLLKLKEEDELLNGSGTGVELSGLVTNATPYDTNRTNVATDSFIDVIGHGLQQVTDESNFEPDAVVLNPRDWETVRQTKTATTLDYIYSDPRSAQTPQIWGVPVVPTKSMARGQFLAGAFGMAAAIWDRNAATVEISREHSDFFVRNMVAILCEERLALTVFRSDALVYGGFPYGS